MIIDISQEVLSCAVYPGDPTPRLERLSVMEDGALYNLSSFSMCAHNGTHVDAPAHFFADGRTVEQLDLSACCGRCYVAHHAGDLSADAAGQILASAREHGCHERLLLADDCVVSTAAAEVFVRGGVRLIGVDSQSVGPVHAPMAVHKILLSADVVLLEGLVLSHVASGAYTLCAAPLKIAGCEGAPCRAVLMTDGD
ncbi:MAG: cyclase family protein [Clostridia bacterium]|nr:cyclase family protein [Clostridia bacterium]